MSTKRSKQHAYLVECEKYMKSRNRQYDGGKSPYHFIGRVKHEIGFELIKGHKNRKGFRWRNYLKMVTGNGNE